MLPTRSAALSPKGAPFAEMPILLRAAAATAADPQRAVADRPFGEAKDALIARFEREYLEDLLRRAGGSMTEAAKRAGLERKYLYRLLERVGIERPKDPSA